MLTLRCTFHVNLETAAALLAVYFNESSELGGWENVSAVRALAAIRQQIERRGEGMYLSGTPTTGGDRPHGPHGPPTAVLAARSGRARPNWPSTHWMQRSDDER